MNIDVITRHAIRNYGSVLQAVATREILAAARAEVRFVDYRQPGYDDSGWSYANRGSARDYPWPLRVAFAALREPGVRKIGRVFEDFLTSELALTGGTYRSTDALRMSPEFDSSRIYCAGSDQVWNVEYNVDNSPYYLDFAPRDALKFSLSSSIGAATLPQNEEDHLVKSLQGFSGISVRESDAVEYLADLGVHAEQHVDPTLGVHPSFWQDFAAPPAFSAPYILVYQLNGSPDFNPVVDAVSHALGIPVKRIEYWRGPRSFRYSSVVLPTVQEFVGLFRDAAFVITDSFHGTVFSTTFRKPFVAVAPPKYSGRITSLLALTHEEGRQVSDSKQAIEVALNTEPLQDPVALLESERSRVHSYVDRVVSSRVRS